jgi:hypothetical protein
VAFTEVDIKYIILEFTTSTILHLPPPTPEIVSTGRYGSFQLVQNFELYESQLLSIYRRLFS